MKDNKEVLREEYERAGIDWKASPIVCEREKRRHIICAKH
jgi:hypothetical protein